MRPYLAIIQDSFREALASRILWVVLILITLFLLALVPVGYRQSLTTEFRPVDIANARGLLTEIKTQGEADEDSPGKVIWSKWDKNTKRNIEPVLSEDARRSGRREASDALNQLLTDTTLYDEKAWADVPIREEVKEYLDDDPKSMSEDTLKRRNRILIEDAFPDKFQIRTGQQVAITYLWFNVTPPIPVQKERVDTVIAEVIVPFLIGILVGVLAVIVALLVTANVIPQMFDAGSLALLLSKPLSRSVMFLSKFVGGCAFVLLNVAFLNTGLWLILGTRFGIWNHGLLLCIPIFLFLFSIYYSVSAFAGVVWRNAIVCVVMAVLLWGLCFIVGLTKGIYENVAIEPRRFINVVSDGEQTFVVNQSATVYRWDETTNDWAQVFNPGFGNGVQVVMGPVIDGKNNRVIAGRSIRGQQLFGRSEFMITSEDEGWEQVNGPQLPLGTFSLMQKNDDQIVAVSRDDITLIGDDLNVAENAEKKKTLFFVEIPKFGTKSPFKSIGPEERFSVNRPAEAAMNQASSEIVVYSAGKLFVMKPEENGFYEKGDTTDLIDEDDVGAAMAYAGDTIVVVLADGRVLEVDAGTQQIRNTMEVEKSSQPRSVVASPDGSQFAVIYHNGNLYTLKPGTKGKANYNKAKVAAQGDISAAFYDQQGNLLVAHDRTSVSIYGSDLKKKQTFTPPMPVYERVYFYVIKPLHMIFPKPGELDQTVQYFISNKETSDFGFNREDIGAVRPKIDPWSPVLSSGAFMIVVLAFACIYIERQDF